MLRRALSVVAAATVASAGLVAFAPASHADDCVTVSDGVLNGTYVCVAPDLSPLVPTVYFTVIPVTVNPACVGTTCTPRIVQHISVPTGFSDQADVYGAICVTLPIVDQQCTPFKDDLILTTLRTGVSL